MSADLEREIKTKAKILDWGLGRNKKQDPQIVLNLSVLMNPESRKVSEDEDDEKVPEVWKSITWYGHLATEKGRAQTIKSILVCGFTGDDLGDLGSGVEGDALDTNREVDVVAGPKPNQAGTEVYDNVIWINAPNSGGGSEIEKFDNKEAKKMLTGLGLKSALANIRKENQNLVDVAEGKVSEDEDDLGLGD